MTNAKIQYEVKQVAGITSSTVEKMSRHDMLEWVNSTVHGQYKKIEELCSGVAYCQMMELLFPHSVNIKRMKINAKLEHEYLHNLKLFQATFTRIGFEKSVPIDRLIKGRFQDNFEFLQWFKKFFDTQAEGKENMKVPAALAALAANAPKPIRRQGHSPLATANGGATKMTTSTQHNPKKSLLPTTPRRVSDEPIIEKHGSSPTALSALQERRAQLVEQIGATEYERNYYYEKLTSIEKLLNDSVEKAEHVAWCKRALNVLYVADGPQSSSVESAEL